MPPCVGNECLQALRQAMTVLHLKGVVDGIPSVAEDIELPREVGIRSIVEVATHELATGRTNVGHREDIGISEALFYCRIPFVCPRQDMIRINHRKERDRRTGCERDWCRSCRVQGKRGTRDTPLPCKRECD